MNEFRARMERHQHSVALELLLLGGISMMETKQRLGNQAMQALSKSHDYLLRLQLEAAETWPIAFAWARHKTSLPCLTRDLAINLIRTSGDW